MIVLFIDRSSRRGASGARLVAGALLVLGVLMPVRASADLVFFPNGRSLSVKSHRLDGDTLVLALRGGGEVTCDRATIARIEPDEVPYPEPVEEVAIALVTGTGATAYGAIIDDLSARHGVDPRLVRAVVQVESAYQPDARSPKGALGLMQLMPATARQYLVDNPFDPHANLDAGIRHLRGLLDRFDLPLALAAYNAGEGAIFRYGGVPPFRETREYVQRVLRLLGPARR